tara:strand:- start:1478 stop:1639 length:162 start_codon:yes stop_codon:yes gene_type:complete
MPTVATQTHITTIVKSGFKDWCSSNMDLVDNIPLPISLPKLRIGGYKRQLPPS